VEACITCDSYAGHGLDPNRLPYCSTDVYWTILGRYISP